MSDAKSSINFNQSCFSILNIHFKSCIHESKFHKWKSQKQFLNFNSKISVALYLNIDIKMGHRVNINQNKSQMLQRISK